MHVLTVFSNINSEIAQDIYNTICVDSGYIIQKSEDYQDYVRFYFDGIKDSAENKNIFKSMRNLLYPKSIDFLIQEPYLPIKLFCFDMDGTSLKIETMDSFCGFYLGLEKRKIMEEKTNLVIEGKMDYIQGFKDKIINLKNIKKDLIDDFYNSHIKNKEYTDGLVDFLSIAHNNKVKTALLSGGFTTFTDLLSKDLGFCYHHASNPDFTKDINNNLIFTGTISDREIFTDKNKKEKLIEYRNYLSLDKYNVCAIGDGSNDIKMLQEAGLGIAYKAKQIVKDSVDNWIEFNDFTILQNLI